MKHIDFFKEKLYLIICSLLVVCFNTLFLLASDVSQHLIVLLDVMILLFTSFIYAREYHRRYDFYKDLKDTLDQLDQKYLINEIIEEPTFTDGKILYETLMEVDKSMCDEIASYRIAQQEYKEYIEMWVHEIKTPIASSNLILDNHEYEYKNELKSELTKIERFVEQALYYAKSNSLEKDYVIAPVSLEKVIYHVLKKHASSFIYRHIAVSLNHLDTIIQSDSKWLEFIIDQITVNALKYSPDESTITFTADVKQDAVILHIQDEGIGILPKDLPNVFEKGFTGSNGRTHEKSTGIGLYLCHKLCMKMHHDIVIESTDQKGTDVILTFPKSSYYVI